MILIFHSVPTKAFLAYTNMIFMNEICLSSNKVDECFDLVQIVENLSTNVWIA